MNFGNLSLSEKRTKIVATLGPATESLPVLTRLIQAGMDVARINFSHGTLESHSRVIANVRAAAAEVGARVAIMADLPGPKMRIGRLEKEPVELERGQPFTIQVGDFAGNSARVSMQFAGLPGAVKPGDSIFINDGYIQLEVQQVIGDEVYTRVQVGGTLLSRKGVNFPGIDLGIGAFTEQDCALLQFACAQQVDAISQSFVQNGKDIQAVRAAAQDIGYSPFIIAKIERARALENLDEILANADGLMVARGDLGVEVPFEEIAIIQKEIIHKANKHGKPVITATHMLESMIQNRRPTRAEVTDVANAIIDGTDCVMLSGETSIGQYPVESVEAMKSIACYTEQHKPSSLLAKLLEATQTQGSSNQEEKISLGLFQTVEALRPDVIFAMTTTGATARRLARFRLAQPIVAISGKEKTCQELVFSYGVYPVFEPQHPPSWARYAADWLHLHCLEARLILLTEGGDTLKRRDTTLIEIINLA